MDLPHSLHGRALFALSPVIVALCLVSCHILLGLHELHAPALCKQLDQAPSTSPSSALPPSKVFEDTGTIAAFHGLASAESTKSGTQGYIKIQQEIDVPSWADHGTVLLNGWRLKYLSGDHHVAGLGTVIRNIRIDRDKLKWEAIGSISDDNFDDPYNWSYAFTVLLWNAANISLAVDHFDGSCEPHDHRGHFYISDNKDTKDPVTTALSAFASFLGSGDFASLRLTTVAPRGFGFVWDGGDDHHLLQLGYNLDHSEMFVERDKKYKRQFDELTPLANSPSRIGAGYASWQTYALFKDDERRRDYVFGELVSGLAGNDLGVVQPPFAILPRDPPSACLDPTAVAQPQEFVVENVPYRYAIPMLTGWELAYGCRGDQHVSEIGIWIDEIQYDPNAAGTLRYKLSSVLRDEDNKPGFLSNHKVTILGMRPVPPRSPATGAQPTQALP